MVIDVCVQNSVGNSYNIVTRDRLCSDAYRARQDTTGFVCSTAECCDETLRYRFVLWTGFELFSASKNLLLTALVCNIRGDIFTWFLFFGAFRAGERDTLQAGRSGVRFAMGCEIFVWLNTSGRTMALGSTQPVRWMSTSGLSWGKGGRCVRQTTLPPSCANCLKLWSAWTFCSLRS
jgi:hypothetical protein